MATIEQTSLSVADTVRHLRETRTAMSARALSIAAGLSESYVGKVEAGGLDPSFRAFAKIAHQLRMTPVEIFVLASKKRPVRERHRSCLTFHGYWSDGCAMRYSASRIKKWMTCPLQAHFHYDLALPVEKNNAKGVFGTCIHAALEYYNNSNGNIDQAIKIFLDLWENPEKVGSPVNTLWWPRATSYGSLKIRGVDILKDTHERCAWDKREVIATEHPFLVPFGEFELTGYVDLLEVRRSGTGKDLLRVVDYKTASRQPNYGELSLDVQFSIYLYASTCKEFWFGATKDGEPDPDFPPIENAEWLYEMHNGLPRRAIWYHLWTQKEIDAGPREDKDFMRLYRVVQEIAKADEAGIHVPKLGENCTLCDYRDPCGVEIPTKEELQAQPNAWL